MAKTVPLVIKVEGLDQFKATLAEAQSAAWLDTTEGQSRMSVVTTRTVTTIRHEYRCPSPACWTDVKEAMAFAARDREAAGLDNRWDDVIKVEAFDDEIVVYWTANA